MNQTIMNAKGSILTLTAILSMVVACVLLCGCAYFQPQQTAMPEDGGILLIKVNPEIAVVYDKDGKVVAVSKKSVLDILLSNSCNFMFNISFCIFCFI